MPANIFQGATMPASIVAQFYPNNGNFDHFIFQQVLANPGSDNVYTLCVYAVLLGGFDGPFQLPALPSNSKPLTGKVQYANMRLDPDGLKTLYPNGVNSDSKPITIVPAGPYAGAPTYMAYNATTPYMDAQSTVTINPSPPYNG